MSISVSLFLLLLHSILVRPSLGNRFQATELYHFPNTTLLENVAVRSQNGHLLLTSINLGELFDLDTQAPGSEPRSLGQLPGASGCTGIVEVEPDVFAVAGGLTNLTTQSYAEGSVRVYKVDLRHHRKYGESGPIISVAAKVNNTTMLNGMVALPHFPGVILTVDSFFGRIFRVDTNTGHNEVIWQDETLAGMNNPRPGGTQLGANGLKLRKGWLYFSNSAQRTFGRVPVSPSGYKTGHVETFSTISADKPGTWADDDFAITDEGIIYVTRHPFQLVKIAPWGEQQVVLGEESDVKLYDPSAATFDPVRNAVYVVTDGAVLTGGKSGGQVVQVLLG